MRLKLLLPICVGSACLLSACGDQDTGDIANTPYETSAEEPVETTPPSHEPIEDQTATETTQYSPPSPYSSSYSNDEREEFDEYTAKKQAEREVARKGYMGIGSPYGCTDDCSGHEAGFEWRRDTGYSSYGTSQSFEEGGRAFDEAVEQTLDRMRSDHELGLDTGY